MLVFQERVEQRAEIGQRSQEQQAEEDQESQRLRLLAGGIAHNFNNLLTAVLGNAELARFEIPEQHPAHDSLAQIAPVVQRAADLAGQLLAYAGDAPILPRSLDLNELVSQLIASLPDSKLSRIAIRVHLTPDLPPVDADATQMHWVVRQLLINAAEAIGELEGTITITTELRQLGGAELATAIVGADLPPGWYAAVRIVDSGCGMDEATLARIFDPFFSTKFTGRGLGLPAVLGIVRQHGGALTVESSPGQGSTFQLALPIQPDS
jgi:signal transduction histidine kinase